VPTPVRVDCRRSLRMVGDLRRGDPYNCGHGDGGRFRGIGTGGHCIDGKLYRSR